MQKRSKIISAALAFLLLFQLFACVTNPHVNGVSGALKVEMYMENTAPTTNTISPNFKITNYGSGVLSLSNVTIRYYFTKDSTSTQNFSCDVSGITGSFTDMIAPTANADNYLEISFPAAMSLAPNASAELKASISKSDGSVYNQANDYSFNSTNTSYTECSKIPAYIFNIKIWGSEPVFDPTHGFLVIVSSKIYGACQNELNTYMSDLANEGWSPTLIKVNNVPDSNYSGDQSFHVCENPNALKQVIRGYYDQGYKGFVLIGSAPSIPNVYWESNATSNEQAPTDLFYADMSNWSDSDGDGSYEQPVNPTDVSVLAPDMICGRISAAGAIPISNPDEATKISMEISKTKGYLLKIHDFRSKAKMDFDPKAFCFIDDDWASSVPEKVTILKELEQEIYCISNKASTNKERFLQFLQGGYRLGCEAVHSSQEGWTFKAHPYGTEDATQEESLGLDGINGITVKVNYLHLDSCSSCDYTTKNIGATLLFNNADTYSTSKDSYVYNVTGDTRPAILAINSTYYQDLKSECIGTAFKNFISNCITQDLSPDYPYYILLGDPTLKYSFTKPANKCPSVSNDLRDINAFTDKPFRINFDTTDPENDPVFLDVAGLPEGASYDSATKTLDWVPQASQAGNSYNVTITAYNKDLSGEPINKYVQHFTIYVFYNMSLFSQEIPNPGFESLNTDGTPSDWAKVMLTGDLSLDPVVKNSGDYSAKIINTGVSPGAYELNIPVEPNTYYLIRGYIKSSNVTVSRSRGAFFMIPGNNGTADAFSASLVGTQDWTPTYIHWNSGNNTSMKIQCRLEENGTAWFDDFKVEKDTEYNLGFEYYRSNTTGINKWTTFNMNFDPTTIQLDSSVKHTGLRSAKIAFDQPNYGYLTSVVPVEPGATYRVGVWVKTSNVSDGSANLSVRCGTNAFQLVPIADAENEWKQVYLECDSGSNTSMTIKCNLGAFNEQATGTIWFDDVTIEKK